MRLQYCFIDVMLIEACWQLHLFSPLMHPASWYAQHRAVAGIPSNSDSTGAYIDAESGKSKATRQLWFRYDYGSAEDRQQVYKCQNNFGSSKQHEKCILTADHIRLYLSGGLVADRVLKDPRGAAYARSTFHTFKPYEPNKFGDNDNRWPRIRDLCHGYDSHYDVHVFCPWVRPADTAWLDLKAVNKRYMPKRLVATCQPFLHEYQGPAQPAGSLAVQVAAAVPGHHSTSCQASPPASQVPVQPAGSSARQATAALPGHRSAFCQASLPASQGPVQPAGSSAMQAGAAAPRHQSAALRSPSSAASEQSVSASVHRVAGLGTSAAATSLQHMHFAGPGQPILVQSAMVQRILTGDENILISGVAGAGKTRILTRHILKRLKQRYGKKLWVTASTGIAAQAIQGTTLHSAAGLGLGNGPVSLLWQNVPTVSFFFEGIAWHNLQMSCRYHPCEIEGLQMCIMRIRACNFVFIVCIFG